MTKLRIARWMASTALALPTVALAQAQGIYAAPAMTMTADPATVNVDAGEALYFSAIAWDFDCHPGPPAYSFMNADGWVDATATFTGVFNGTESPTFTVVTAAEIHFHLSGYASLTAGTRTVSWLLTDGAKPTLRDSNATATTTIHIYP